MLASVHPQGADLSGLDLAIADPRDDLAEVTFESSRVGKAGENLMTTVFTGGREDTGRECMVAAGGFTFSTFVWPSAPIAARLMAMDSRTT